MKYSTLLPLLMAANTLFAQTEQQTLSSEAEEEQVEVMIVTAQKRKQSIQQVPLAISAFSGDDVIDFRLQNINDIASVTPSFSMGQFNLGQPQLYIRGIGSNEDGAGGDNSVVVFIDGVYIGRSSGAMFDFYDVERIEVLRGPQGTLYGKNVIGGAINLITHRADAITDQQLHASVGKDNLVQLQSLNAVDLTDSVSAKVALLKTRQDGYIYSKYGFDLNDKNDTGFKAELFHQAQSALTTRVAFDWLQQRQSGAGRHPQGGILGDQILPELDPEAAADPFYSFANIRGHQRKDIRGFAITNQWDNDWGAFTLINGWRRHDFAFLNDDLATSDAEFYLDIVNGADETARQHSHELRWQKQWGDFDWLSGLYAFYEDVARDEYFAANLIPTGLSIQRSESHSYALFSHLIYPLSNQLELTIGGRLTKERKAVRQQGVAGFVISENYQVANSASWQHFTPKAALSYQISDRQSAYFSIARGFKSGGFQGQAPTAAAAETPFNEELATNYELGFKGSYQKGQLWFHAAVFQTDYQDLQTLELMQQQGQEVGVLITQNAASAVVKGLELETKLQLTGNFNLRANYSYLDARYNQFYQDQNDARVGNRLRNAPQHAGAIWLEYHHNITQGHNLSWRYSHSYQDKRYQDPENLADAAIPAYDVASLSASLEAQDQSWRVSFWIDNLWNEQYYLHNFPVGTITNPSTPAPPRRYGVTFSLWY